MCQADVTAISIFTNMTREEVCHTLIPYTARALSNQRVRYQRMPINRGYIDWVIEDSYQITLALDDVGDSCVILLATRSTDRELSAARLANVAAELCRDYAGHTLFWNGSDRPIDALEFLFGYSGNASVGHEHTQVVPRRVRAQSGGTHRAAPAGGSVQVDNAALRALRSEFMVIDAHELEWMELEERRAKTAPLRLSAWAMSMSTALIAAPLAIPLFVHNLVRGEDLRAGALSLGVAGFYASLAHSGLVPWLSFLL